MFTRTETKNIMSELDVILKEFQVKHGVSVSRKGAKFGQDIEVKVIFNKIVDTVDGKVADTKESRAFKDNFWRHNIPLTALNEKIPTKDGELIIKGYSSRSPKYPLQYTINGRGMKCSISYILKLLKESNSQYGV